MLLPQDATPALEQRLPGASSHAAEDDEEHEASFVHIEEMIRDQAYRGSRYSFGYPACPDLEDRRTTVRLLDPSRIGVDLSEELQLHPEQSTDAIVVHHPQAKYFAV